MFRTRVLILVGVVVGLAVVQTAPASFILPNGPFNLNIRNYDMASTYDETGNKVSGPPGGVGNEDGWGIFKVIGITDSKAKVVWRDGDGGIELTGVFYGLADTSVSWDPIFEQWTIRSTGLRLDLWENVVGSFDPTPGSGGRIGANGYQGITDVGGTHLLSALTRAGGPGYGLPEFESVVQAGSGFGHFRAWADVTGGTMAANFDTNTQLGTTAPGKTDLYLSSDFFPNTGPGDWMFESSDPVRGSFIPEPASLALLSVGLLPLLRRRKRS